MKEKTSVQISTDGAAIVDRSYPWEPIETCAHGAKCQLLGRHGAAYYGNGPDGYAVAWAPLPYSPPHIKERLA